MSPKVDARNERRPTRISSPEDARAFILATIEQLEDARRAVDVLVPGIDAETLVRAQRQNEQMFFMRYGYAMATLDAAHARGELADEGYGQLRTRIVLALQPTKF